MQIKELENQTGVSVKTIRYYESIGILPEPQRQLNGYRVYHETDVDRLKLVAGARRLDLSLDEIKELLDMRDRKEAPCTALLEQLDQKADEIHQRIKELQHMEKDLRDLRQLGLTFPTNDVEGKNCVCHLVSEKAN